MFKSSRTPHVQYLYTFIFSNLSLHSFLTLQNGIGRREHGWHVYGCVVWLSIQMNVGGGRVGENKTALCDHGSQAGTVGAADQAEEAGVECGAAAWPTGI